MKHIHITGICGTAMASMAGLLKQRGYKVTGSDAAAYPPASDQLKKMGIPIMEGYRAENLQPHPDLVVVGNVIRKEYEESQYMLAQNIPHTSFPKMLGELVIEGRNSLVVAGTHGKTTTTALSSWAMTELGLKPGYLIGGVPKNLSSSFCDPPEGGEWFVIEGDEYDTAFFDKVPKFVHYHPKYVTLTGIEFDHIDIYPDLDAVKESFRSLLKLIPKDRGHLVYYADCENVGDVLGSAECSTHSYGIKNGTYRAIDVQYHQKGTDFKVLKRDNELGEFQLALSGEYNVLNALSFIVHADILGWDQRQVKKSLASFAGVKRRQEILGSPGDVLVIEDFAHHPTAVKSTIQAMKKQYPQRRLISVFEPRSATSRHSVFQAQYAESFTESDFVLLAKPYDQSRIAEDERFSTLQLVSALEAQDVSAQQLNDADQIVSWLLKESRPGDLILIMSNGGFDSIYSKLMSGLEQRLKHNSLESDLSR